MFFASKIVRIGFAWNGKAWKAILKEALPISISAMLGYLYFKLDTIFLSIIPLSGGLDNATVVGIYGSAYKVLEILLLVPAIFLGSVFPVMSRFLESKDDRVGLLLQRSVEVMALFGFPVTLLLLIGAPQIISFVAGQAFMEAVVPLRILSLAILINYFSTVFTYTALTLNKQVSLIKIYLVAVVCNAVANYVFIPEYTYRAAAWVTFGTELIVLVFPCIVCVSALKFKPQFGLLGRTLLASLLFGAVLWLARDASLFMLILLTCTFYPAFLWICRALQPKELVSLLRGSV
jgi:O-antigen/teichoic acid export membrane protein